MESRSGVCFYETMVNLHLPCTVTHVQICKFPHFSPIAIHCAFPNAFLESWAVVRKGLAYGLRRGFEKGGSVEEAAEGKESLLALSDFS